MQTIDGINIKFYLRCRMELRQLKYFVTVASELNFSKAAEKLYITQGTLSQQIRQLEGELNSELFNRTSRSVTLTEAGAELLPLAKKTLEDSLNCRQRMAELREALGGSLNIGVTHSFAGLLTETVRRFLKEHRGVKLNIFYKTATELHEMLREGDVDLIIAFKPAIAYDGIVSEPLFDSRLAAIMRHDHPLSGRQKVTMEEISKYGIVLPGSGLQARKAFERFIDVDTSDLDVRIELNEPNIIMDIVEHSSLVAILSTLAIHYNSSLVAIPIEGIDRPMTGCVHYLGDAYRKRAATVFTQMLIDTIKY